MNAAEPSGGRAAARWLAIVPTLGRSRHLADSVSALRDEGGTVLVVAPAGSMPAGLPTGDDGVVSVWTDGEQGFAAANLAGLAAAPAGEFVALVNDDAVVEPGWAAALVAELDAHPDAAAAQGVVLRMSGAGTGDVVDGAGLAWNRWWQAVQLNRGRPATDAWSTPQDIFGVSATAALYRRRALDDVGTLFDPSLDSYYEDVDLAVRLRAAGWTARCVPAARARHAGSTTGRARGGARLARRNRYRVLARALGWRLLPRLPKVVLRDAVDAARALATAEFAGSAAIVTGTLAGLVGLPGQLRTASSGPAPAGRMAPGDLRRWTP